MCRSKPKASPEAKELTAEAVSRRLTSLGALEELAEEHVKMMDAVFAFDGVAATVVGA